VHLQLAVAATVVSCSDSSSRATGSTSGVHRGSNLVSERVCVCAMMLRAEAHYYRLVIHVQQMQCVVE
jgi:hypothetical protein